MRNLIFVIWMILFPITSSIQGHLNFLQGKTYSVAVEGIVAIFFLVVWFYVGKLLYEKKVEV